MKKKFNDYNTKNLKIKKDCFKSTILKSKMEPNDYNLMVQLVNLRNNLAHDCIKNTNYSRVFAGDIQIGEGKFNYIYNNGNQNLDKDGNKLFIEEYNKIKNYIPDNLLIKHKQEPLFIVLFNYIIDIVDNLNLKDN